MSKINIEYIKDDIENLEIGGEFRGVTPEYLLKLLRELKRSYEREDQLIDALNIIKQDLESGEDVQKIINFANDAAL